MRTRPISWTTRFYQTRRTRRVVAALNYSTSACLPCETSGSLTPALRPEQGLLLHNRLRVPLVAGTSQTL